MPDVCDDRQADGFVLEILRIGSASHASAVLFACMSGDIGCFRPWTPWIEQEDGGAELRVVLTILNYSPLRRTLARNDAFGAISLALRFG